MSTVNEKMTAIADNIRSYTGNTEKLSLDDMAENIEKVYKKGQDNGYVAGQKAGYDLVWDIYQRNGKRSDYQDAFAGVGWTDKLFKPKYDIKPTTAYEMFRKSKITDLTNLQFKLDFSQANNVKLLFFGSEIKKIGILDFRNTSDLSSTFANAFDLVSIFSIVIKLGTVFTNTFDNNYNLEEVRFSGTISENISFKDSSKLSDESQDSIIGHLKDLTGATSKTLTVHADVYNRMVASGKVALVIVKNWTLVKAK